jgi:hypothetical protein
MLDRENKREKILEGKLREIKIKLKNARAELQDAKVNEMLQLQAELPPEDVFRMNDEIKVKPELVEGDIYKF